MKLKSLTPHLTITLLILLLFMPGCSGGPEPPGSDGDSITGLIYAIEDGSILVVQDIDNVNLPQASWFESGKRAIYFKFNETTVIELAGIKVGADRLARGQVVEVFHTGMLAESYPEQGTAVRILIVTDSQAGD